MMHHISESHNASSWPVGYERHIQVWVDAGDPCAPPPFEDRYRIVTPEFFNRLRELRQMCGGWFYFDNDQGVTFASEAEWQRVRAAQEAAEAEWRRKEEESKKRTPVYPSKGVAKVLLLARADTAFWSELREWELAREAQRPSDLPYAPDSPSAVAEEVLIQEKRAEFYNLPVDPMFSDFFGRVRQANDVLTARDIVLNLRG
jgi:hypothetical protein